MGFGKASFCEMRMAFRMWIFPIYVILLPHSLGPHTGLRRCLCKNPLASKTEWFSWPLPDPCTTIPLGHPGGQLMQRQATAQRSVLQQHAKTSYPVLLSQNGQPRLSTALVKVREIDSRLPDWTGWKLPLWVPAYPSSYSQKLPTLHSCPATPKPLPTSSRP